MSWPPLPKPDRQNTLEWPWWEVDLEEEDLCGFLYKKYNTATIFLQDLPSFYRDVVELVRETKTGSKDEFLHLLGERKARREKEITSAHGQTCAALAHGSQTLSASQYRNLLRWTQYSSLDALVEFLASFGPDGGGNKRLSTAKSQVDAESSTLPKRPPNEPKRSKRKRCPDTPIDVQMDTGGCGDVVKPRQTKLRKSSTRTGQTRSLVQHQVMPTAAGGSFDGAAVRPRRSARIEGRSRRPPSTTQQDGTTARN
ncbi:hypothetical protein Purlil1_13054 [Purpureocillium lilacinum]|uniref:Uncharacterized protein n=1 Tax=Purpureocillium lilacinum TaxID=33203 RepID=A0ABR0BF26_PURLI|nr:hypothetical protein Purlil1_13054 [Purpureocillium lilacinum]